MGKFFSYEGRFMQVLRALGDFALLNVIYLVCCLPVFTIGAAQAGMSTAFRQLLRPDDDRSPHAAFFRGFREGFGKVTLAWGLFTVLMGAAFASFLLAYNAAGQRYTIPAVLCIIAMILFMFIQAIIPIIHSQLECSVLQLMVNSWLLLLAHPVRCIVSTILIWSPVFMFLFDPFMFLWALPITLTCLFSLVYMGIASMMKKPFKKLISQQ